VPIYRKVNKDFFKKWTAEMAYILGFFAADGCITHNKRGAYFWSIQITDKKLLNSIKKVIQSDHAIGIRNGKNKNHSILYRLQIGNKEMCDDLRMLGMRERKTKSLAIPNVPEKYFPDFVRGYFDGDGSVWAGYQRRDRPTQSLAIQTIFTSCSIPFLETLALRLGIYDISGCVYKERNTHARLRYSIRSSLKLYDFMYNNSVAMSQGLFLERKNKIFERYMHMRP
jgi:hypothetical protein